MENLRDLSCSGAAMNRLKRGRRYTDTTVVVRIYLFLCISPEGKKSKSSAAVISGFHSFTFLFFISLYRKNFTRRHSYQQPTFPLLRKGGEKGGEFEKESTVNRFERVTYFCYFLVL